MAVQSRHWSPTGFNPRAHEGRDFIAYTEIDAARKVSIHAPTRGATRPEEPFPMQGIVSIHAPTRGATVIGDGVCSG